jgi:hypothetical protein
MHNFSNKHFNETFRIFQEKIKVVKTVQQNKYDTWYGIFNGFTVVDFTSKNSRDVTEVSKPSFPKFRDDDKEAIKEINNNYFRIYQKQIEKFPQYKFKINKAYNILIDNEFIDERKKNNDPYCMNNGELDIFTYGNRKHMGTYMLHPVQKENDLKDTIDAKLEQAARMLCHFDYLSPYLRYIITPNFDVIDLTVEV